LPSKWLLSKSVFQTLVCIAQQKGIKNYFYAPNHAVTIWYDGLGVTFDHYLSKICKISQLLHHAVHRKAQNTWFFVKKRRILCSGAKERKMLYI